jgi:hypothetical protein
MAAVKACNDSPHSALRDGAPDDIRGPGGEVKNKLLYFRREQQEADNMETNSEQIQERAERLEKHGVFRVWKDKRGGWAGAYSEPSDGAAVPRS